MSGHGVEGISAMIGGGQPVAVGVDFATLTDDGRIRSITGFLEPAA